MQKTVEKSAPSLGKVNFKLLVANVRLAYYQAIQYPTIEQSGLRWYQSAKDQAQAIASRNGVSLQTAIGVISALSPRNSWERNLVDAEVCIKAAIRGKQITDFKVSVFNANKENAWRIAKGESPLEVMQGNKTRSFYTNILKPQDPYNVTIDGHALHIALGLQSALENAPQLTDKNYLLFSQVYLEATRQINQDSLEGSIIASQLQAITWCYYRVIRGIDKSFSID